MTRTEKAPAVPAPGKKKQRVLAASVEPELEARVERLRPPRCSSAEWVRELLGLAVKVLEVQLRVPEEPYTGPRRYQPRAPRRAR